MIPKLEELKLPEYSRSFMVTVVTNPFFMAALTVAVALAAALVFWFFLTDVPQLLPKATPSSFPPAFDTRAVESSNFTRLKNFSERPDPFAPPARENVFIFP